MESKVQLEDGYNTKYDLICPSRLLIFIVQQSQGALLSIRSVYAWVYKIVRMEANYSMASLPSGYNPQSIFRVELNPEELVAVSSLLPQGYSLHPDHRKKQSKSHPKKKNVDEPLPDQHPQPKHPPTNSKSKPQPIPEAFKPCLKTLQSLQQHKCAWPFLQPVDVEAMGIPEYLQIVKEPMDLSTVEGKLKGGKYETPAHFHADILKILNNSYLFNHSNQDFIKVTGQFQRYYFRISGQPRPPAEKMPAKVALMQSRHQKKKKKQVVGSRQLMEGPITTEEKQDLATHICRLAKQHVKSIRSIVFEGGSEENTFDLEKLPVKKVRELQKFIQSRLLEMESKVRSTLEKNEQPNLDDLQSSNSQQFIRMPL